MFFFFKQKTAYEMRISDWSSDVCSSDLKVIFTDEPERAVPWQQRTGHSFGAVLLYNAIGVFADDAALEAYPSWKGAKPGDLIFEDVSGDGKITSDDRILLDRADAPELFYRSEERCCGKECDHKCKYRGAP